MTNLSPQAQAVLDAAYDAFSHGGGISDCIVSALREVANQLQYYQCCGDEGAEDMVLDARAILDVADELEAL